MVRGRPGKAPVEELLQAVAHALGGDWPAAHLIAQDYEEDDDASWIHAVVHRMEGDLANARYWYGRCRRDLREGVSTQDELKEIEAVLAYWPDAGAGTTGNPRLRMRAAVPGSRPRNAR